MSDIYTAIVFPEIGLEANVGGVNGEIVGQIAKAPPRRARPPYPSSSRGEP
jgi:hypothetical protein